MQASALEAVLAAAKLPPSNEAQLRYPRDDTMRGRTPMPRITFNLNGQAVDVPYEPGMHFLEVLREECGVVSVKDGCSPGGHLRLLPGHGRRTSGAVLPAETGADGRPAGGDGRGSSRRHAADPERGVRPGRRRAVRVLHPGDSRPRGVVDRTGARGGSGRGGESARRPSLPLHRLRPDHRRHPDGRATRRATAGGCRAPSRGGIPISAKSSG